jgi:hypothetical protein
MREKNDLEKREKILTILVKAGRLLVLLCKWPHASCSNDKCSGNFGSNTILQIDGQAD